MKGGICLFRMHVMRLVLMEHLSEHLPALPGVGGVRAVPLLQVLVMLTTDVEPNDDHDRAALDKLLESILKVLELQVSQTSNLCEGLFITKFRRLSLFRIHFLSISY